MATLRKSYWYVSLYFKKHLKIILGAVVAGIALFTFILPLLTYLPQVKPTKYIGIIGSYDLSSLPKSIQEQVSVGLTKIQEDGSALPELSERWSIEDEGRTYRFILKDGMTWQDGKPFESSDINFNFQDTQIVTTENEVLFKLTEPFSPFPIVVSQPLFREVETTQLRFIKRKKILGLGEYSIAKTKYQDNRLSELVLDSPNERIMYRFYLTEDKAVTAFKRGNIDSIQEISNTTEFSDWPNITITPNIRADQYLAIFFNHNDPLFTKNVRQALSYALQKQPTELRARGPISPFSWAFLESVKSYEYDPSRAVERLLDEVPQQPMNITLVTNTRFQSEANTVKQEWENIGVRASQECASSDRVEDKNLCQNLNISVNVNVSNFPDTSNYQVMLIGQQMPFDPDQYSLWHSTQNTNFAHYKNPRIDALLENGRKASDQNERKAIYQEFQQFLLEDSPAVFWKYLENYTVTRKS